MKQIITQSAFIDEFRAYNRCNQFGREALVILFDYFEEIEADTGEEIELDVIAICCDYSVDTVDEIAETYDIDIDDMDDDEKHEAVMKYLNKNTTVCGECADGIVYCTAF